MKAIEYRDLIDRTGWPEGPWDDEPDKLQFPDPATGLPCLIKRNTLGALCGYVGVAPGHPWFEKPYDDVDVQVHGGLTYADRCDGDEIGGICHLPEPGEPEPLWWLGFDCGHFMDVLPRMEKNPEETQFTRDFYRTYKDIPYVRAECARLAEQVANAA